MPGIKTDQETQPEHIEQISENKMMVEHDDGSKFECNFNGKFPDALKKNKKPPGRGKYFKGFGKGSDSIRKNRERLGLD